MTLKKLYHGTLSTRVDDIRRRGIHPSSRGQFIYSMNHFRPNWVYVTDDIEKAYIYGLRQYDEVDRDVGVLGDTRVVAVVLDAECVFGNNVVHRDYMGDRAHDYMVKGGISPRCIVGVDRSLSQRVEDECDTLGLWHWLSNVWAGDWEGLKNDTKADEVYGKRRKMRLMKQLKEWMQNPSIYSQTLVCRADLVRP